MTIEEIKLKLEEVLTPRRFIHSLNVMNTATELAKRYGADKTKAALAGLLHDCARDLRNSDILGLCEAFNLQVDEISQQQPELLHGPIGALLLKQEFGIDDEEIEKAIWYHTTGNENMSALDKIVFLADYVEPDRNCPGVNDVRKTAFNNMDQAVLLCLDRTLKHVISKGALVHPNTVSARNWIIRQLRSGT